jgi:hypothetical protein
MVTFCITGGIGDSLIGTAVIREYRRVNPEEIIVLHNPPAPEVWKHNPNLAQGFRRCERRVDLYSMDRTWEGTAVGMNCSRLGIVTHSELPEIHLTTDETGTPFGISSAQETRAVAIDVNAGWPSRMWPLEKFQRLADRLLKAGWYVVQVGRHDAGLRIRCSASFLNKLTVRETAVLLSRCELFVGNESGLMHLAAAVGTPQVVIYSLTGRWQAPYLSGIAVKPRVSCDRACWFSCVRHCVPGMETCLEGISVEEVEAAVDVARERFKLLW